MLLFASAVAAFVPMFTYLLLIWRFDRYDREPFKLVLSSYLWGAIGAIIFAIIGSLIFSIFVSIFTSDSSELQKLGTVAIAPITEEITKGIFLLIVISSKKFDNITDGIVYGGAIGLGFGMTENFLYFISFAPSIQDWLAIVIIRTLFSAVMHGVATAIVGAAFGLAKFKTKPLKFIYPAIGLIIAILIHATWNFSVSFKNTAALGFVFMGITLILFFILFSISIFNERKMILSELSDEASLGTIPITHPAIISSSKRNYTGWIEEKIRKTYIKSAITLAFRKVQLRSSTGNSKKYYETDVNNYRTFIKSLLATGAN